MADPIPIKFPTRSNPARYTQGGTAGLVNCYVEQMGAEGKAPAYLTACDGLEGFAATPEANGGVRAALEVGGVFYYVCGTGFFSLTEGGNVTLIGSMNISTTAPVFMARNRRATPDIAIVCDGLMYYYRTTFQQVTDIDLLAPTSLTFIDGIFVIGTANNTWQAGDIDDASSWDGLSFERADKSPDAVVRVAATQAHLVVFGEVTTEFWVNAGLADGTGFAFSAANDLGCIAANSVAAVEQTLAWVAHDRTVRMLNGFAGTRISTHAVERDIERLTDRTQITASSWVKDGHTFYAITSPLWTWVYDTVTGEWHNRKSYGQANWRINTVTAAFNTLLAGDRESGNIYEMSSAFGDEAGDPLVMDVVFAPTNAYPHPLTFNRLWFDVEKGVGTGQGATQNVAPQIMLRWSDDGGATFAYERALGIGQQGARRTRVNTDRLGQCGPDGRVFGLSCSANVARALYQVMADVEKDAA